MAIGYARMRCIGRSGGGNAVGYVAYVERSKTLCERTGEVFDFRSKENDVLSNRVMLPEGAMELDTSHKLWNAAEFAAKRKDSQVARELVLALPRDPEITDAERVEMAEQFAAEHFVSKGLAAQVVVHRGWLGPPGPKVAFTGGYECNDHTAIWAALDRVHAKHPGMVLLHGGAPKGAERIAACWADARTVPQVAFRPDFARHRNAAPFKRNDQLLAVLPIGVVVFPGSGISDNLADKARALGIPLFDFRKTGGA